jgi:hypothetical protein
MEDSYRALESLITVEAHEYSRAMSNLLSATFLYPSIKPIGIDPKVISDFKEMVGKDIKSLIELYTKFKPNNFDDMKLFLLSVTELGVQFKNTTSNAVKNQGRRFVENVDNHLGHKASKKEVQKKTVVNKDQRKKKKFQNMGFVSMKDEKVTRE